MQAVRRMQRSRLERLSVRRQPWMRTYLQSGPAWQPSNISYSHHLGNTEAVTEVVKRIVSIVFLHFQKKTFQC